MDDNTKKMILGQFEILKKSLEIGNVRAATQQSADIITIALANNSKMGVLIGEIMESSLLQYYGMVYEHNIERSSVEDEAAKLLDCIAGLKSKIDNGDDLGIYQSLSELRMHVTYNQIVGFSVKYKMKPRRRTI
ncbi:MAG: hypothetical protein OXC46_10215 [Thaumarchaeota archaeon]|nr:hypothetical protein [Nitrososphaerota archaeon]